MNLDAKYEKTNLIGEGEVQVWQGRDKARGTAILLHQFSGSPRLLRLAVEYLIARPQNSPLLEIGEVAGATCLVTTYDLELLDITAWLEASLAASRAASAAPEPFIPQFAPHATETPKTFQGNERQRVDLAALGQTSAVPSRPNPPLEHVPGEFTRAFQLPGSSASPAAQETPAPPSIPSAAPGEFTRLFQVPNPPEAQRASTESRLPSSGFPPPQFQPPVAPPSEMPPASSPPPGEFTRLFKLPPQGSDASVPAPAPPPISSNPRPFGDPSGAPITQKLQAGVNVAPPAPPPPAGPSEYTRVIRTQPVQTSAPPPVAAAPSSASSAQAVPLPSAVPPVPSVPSMPQPPSVHPPVVSTPHVQAPVPYVAMPPAPAPVIAKPRPGISPVVLFFGGLIVVALLLVLFVALR